jgi:hypothetical protein
MMAATATETCNDTHTVPCAVVGLVHKFGHRFNTRPWHTLRPALFLLHSECLGKCDNYVL